MIENGIIYKYTNNINGMIYIGQTKQTLEQRDKKHLTQLKDNTFFHRALQKYGRENFSLEIIEQNIPFEKLNEREKYWIKELDSYYTSGRGYNLTQGGQWGNTSQKLTFKQADEIKNLILNTDLTFQEIANQYDVTIYSISDINRGKTFVENRTYPLRQSPTRSVIDENKLNIILDMLFNTTLTQLEIALATDVNEYTVGEINRGSNSWCPKDISYPIRKPIQKNTYQNLLTLDNVKEICYDLCFTNVTLENIGKKFGVAKNTIGDISRGISWKQITSQFKCPIRQNKIENQKIYQSIYGIV